MGKKSSNKQQGAHELRTSASPQLELSFVRRASAVSSNVVVFPKAMTAPQANSSSDSALKRLLDYAATLPGN